MDLIIDKLNEVHLFIRCENSIAMELSEYFTFYVPGYKFVPAYRNKLWDGKIRLYDTRRSTLYLGLLEYVKKFCEERNYEYDITFSDKDEEVQLLDLPIASRGKEIELRDYQRTASLHALTNKKSLLLSPTASGKSLIIYTMIRWYLKNHNERVLLVVPTTSLVEQMYSDFEDYSTINEWSVEDNCHRIYSGKEKLDIVKRVVITTWQSIHTLPKHWFSPYGMIIGDEAHNFKAKSLTKIMESLIHAEYRIGTTGTLDGTKTHKLVLEGVFGPVYDVVTTKELIDNKTLSDLKISTLLLKYDESIRKSVKGLKYAEELEFLVSHEPRNRFIRNLAIDQTGNTLVLFNYVEKHGEPLYKMIKDKVKDNRKVFFIHGKVDTKEREEVREIVEKESNAIIVASLGTFSTGVNLRNLHNLIFASPSKSQIRVLQSIGRGLRKSDDERMTNVFDIADDLSWKSKRNYTLNHAGERINMYAKQKLNYKIYEVKL